MNKDLIPLNLHHVISLAEKWGIDDDTIRDQSLYNSSTDELQNFVNNFTNNVADKLNQWLTEPDLVKQPTLEYLKFSNLFLAFEYAESLLISRNNNI